MNFMSIVGIVEAIKINKGELRSIIYIRIDNVLYSGKLNQLEYQIVPIKLNNQVFKRELKFLKSGAIVGVKGRIECLNSQIDLLAERIKIF
ncbi:MAG: hypothetical protein J6Y96_01850 [Mycoplasma sp.]|nr:hypothetical protein [Mycoplasma sp.]